MKKQAPVIVPPVFQKDFTIPFLEETWKRIYRVVSGASDLHFIGYSLPREDQFARLVLSRALRTNRLRTARKKQKPLRVHVVNPDESTQVTFLRLLGQTGRAQFRFHHTTFDAYVNSVADGSLDAV